MRILSTFLLGAIASSSAFAAVSEADLQRLRELIGKANELHTVDLGYCMHEYPQFEARIERLQASPAASALHGQAEAHGINESPRADRDFSPSEEACNLALSKVEQLLDANADWLIQLARSAPTQN
jgi:hypothetical protein